MNKDNASENFGAVASIRGSVVDVTFDNKLPAIYSVLRTGAENRIVMEVLAQIDEHRVRAIALTPTQGLARGMKVEDTGKSLQAPVGKEILSRMFDVRGNTIDRELTVHHRTRISTPDRSINNDRFGFMCFGGSAVVWNHGTRVRRTPKHLYSSNVHFVSF